jgi:hypothetical protein
MVVLIVTTIIVAGFVYKRFTKRRARQRVRIPVLIFRNGLRCVGVCVWGGFLGQ